MSERLTVARVLDEAERQLDEHDPATSGMWPYAAAVLTRQALEATLDGFWRLRAAEMTEYPFRDRWACLPAYLGERDAARRAHLAWTALSEAVHHRAYDVGLTVEELRGHVATGREFLATVGDALGG